MSFLFEHVAFDSFSHLAPALRKEFESRFLNHRSTRENRFVWDPWFIPGQYQLLRTPAAAFFSQRLIHRFMKELVLFGRSEFGCENISTPWLSLYREGDFQGFHADVPHGPFAFVYSLTPEILFSGGETLLLRSEVLSYWQQPRMAQNFEEGEIFTKIASPFNRLTVFDPRIPHGVSRLSGVSDPLKGRLVIHGWFVNSSPQVEGKISSMAAHKAMTEFMNPFLEAVTTKLTDFEGILVLKLTARSGKPLRAKLHLSTLRNQYGSGIEVAAMSPLLAKCSRLVKLTRAGSPVEITIPVVFQR